MNRQVRQCVLGLAVALGVGFAVPADAQSCTPVSTPLVAGQHFQAGTISITNDASYLYVSYNTNSPWTISEAHAAVASTLEGLPQTRAGNPMPGRFAYSATFDADVTNHVFTIALGSIVPGQTIFVAAHAVVNAPREEGGSQTGWGFGPNFPGRNWATYVNYTVQDCSGGGGGGNS